MGNIVRHHDSTTAEEIHLSASSAKLDDQDLFILIELVEQEIADTQSWSQRATALVALREKLVHIMTGQEALELADDEA